MPLFQADPTIDAIETAAALQTIVRARIREAVARDWRALSRQSLQALEDAMTASVETTAIVAALRPSHQKRPTADTVGAPERAEST